MDEVTDTGCKFQKAIEPRDDRAAAFGQNKGRAEARPLACLRQDFSAQPSGIP